MNSKIFAAVALGVALSGNVFAAPPTYNAYHYGDVTGISVADTIYESVKGAFEDDHFFKVTSAANGYGIVSNIKFAPFIDIDSLTVYLWKDNGVAGKYEAGVDTPLVYIGSGDVIQNGGSFVPGDYFFKITGAALGNGFNFDPSDAGMEYGAYFFNASTVPVPEAETWAMMAMGLGLVGLQLRRRAKKSEAAIAC